MSNADHLLTEAEVADAIGKSVSSLRLWRRQHKGPAFYRIGATPKYHRDDVVLWMQATRVTPGDKIA